MLEIPSLEERNTIIDAIHLGTEVRKYIRIQVIGKNGVGKTSLVRRLLCNNNLDVKSTDGIDIDRTCQIRTSDGIWIVDKGETHLFIPICKLYRIIVTDFICLSFNL